MPSRSASAPARLSAILAHLQRGILRAAALQRVLLARAASGRDIEFVAPPKHATAKPSAPPAEHAADHSVAQPAEQAAEAPVAREHEPRPSRPRGWNDPELFMPTTEEMEAQARRRPLGRTIVEICLDLAVVPGFCAGPFWNTLFDAIRLYGGSIASLMQQKMRRQEAFCEEQDRKPGSNWDWQAMGREALRRVLGFFIGEPVAESFDPIEKRLSHAAAVATGPP